jgi:hypothetical protein
MRRNSSPRTFDAVVRLKRRAFQLFGAIRRIAPKKKKVRYAFDAAC